MGKLGVLYKVTYEMKPKTTEDVENPNEEKLSVSYLDIRNRNADGSYRYYDENRVTVNMKPEMMGGVFIESDLQAVGSEFVRAFFITDDVKYDNLINNKVEYKKGDQEHIDEIKNGLRKFCEDYVTQIIEESKRIAEKIKGEDGAVVNVDTVEETRIIDAEVVSESEKV